MRAGALFLWMGVVGCGANVVFEDASTGGTDGSGASGAGTVSVGGGASQGGSEGTGGSSPVDPVALECEKLCNEGCNAFGLPDCVSGCMSSLLDEACASPFLTWLQCLEGCTDVEACAGLFEPYRQCLNPFDCQVVTVDVGQNDCVAELACNQGHVAGMSCKATATGESCECDFDGVLQGTCENSANTQCSTLFPCCQPFWRP